MKKFIAAVSFFFMALAVPAHADITIGLIGPLSGSEATFGEQLRHGTQQAVDDINAAGGLMGQKLRVEILDDACDPKQSVTAANQLISKGIKFIVGPFCSASAIPASKVVLEEKAILISPSATNPKLTDEGGPGIFRVCGRDDQQGSIVGNLILKEFKGEKVAILHDKSAWGKGIADEVKKTINAGGVQEVIFDSYNPKEKDYSAIVTLLKQKGIEVMFIGGYQTEVGLIIRQLRAAGSKLQLIGGDALANGEFWNISGGAAEDALMTFGPDPRKNPQAASIVKALKDKGFDPAGYTLYSYGAVQVVAEAIKQAGGADTAKAIPIMQKTTFKTVLGDISFNSKGDLTKPAFVIYRWHNGQYEER